MKVWVMHKYQVYTISDVQDQREFSSSVLENFTILLKPSQIISLLLNLTYTADTKANSFRLCASSDPLKRHIFFKFDSQNFSSHLKIHSEHERFNWIKLEALY